MTGHIQYIDIIQRIRDLSHSFTDDTFDTTENKKKWNKQLYNGNVSSFFLTLSVY